MNESNDISDALSVAISAISDRPKSLHIMVDPSTIAAIISIGQSIASLFGGGDDIGQIIELLKGLDQSVSDVARKIDEISQALSKLEVFIDRQLVKQKDADILGISDAIKAYLAVWKTDHERCKREVPGYLQALQYAVGANIRYSYAGYDAVAYGLSIERSLLELLKEVSSVKHSRYSQYQSYFRANLDASRDGTVANRLAAAQAARQAFISQNTLQSQARFMKRIAEPVVRSITFTPGGTLFGDQRMGDLCCVISGNPEAGYTAEAQVTNERYLMSYISSTISPGGNEADGGRGLPDFSPGLQQQCRDEANAIAAKLTADMRGHLADFDSPVSSLNAARGVISRYSEVCSNLLASLNLDERTLVSSY